MKWRSGDELLIEKYIKIQILWPKKEQITENILNNNSIVAKLVYEDFSMLFTGDIEEIAEKQILSEYKNNNHLYWVLYNEDITEENFKTDNVFVITTIN